MSEGSNWPPGLRSGPAARVTNRHHPEKSQGLGHLKEFSELRLHFFANRHPNRAEIHARSCEHHLLYSIGDARLKELFAIGCLARGQIDLFGARVTADEHQHAEDRKSTRLNSSHIEPSR